MSILGGALTIAILGVSFSSFGAQEDRPELIFESELTWKGVFDAGFRPRHVLGLETTKAESINEGFDFRFAGDSAVFEMSGGRTLFAVLENGEVDFLKHDESERISVSDALDRLRDFTKMGEGYIFRNPLEGLDLEMSEEDLVRELDKKNVIVRRGESAIQFGFRRSLFKEKPLQAIFFLSSRNIQNIAGRTLTHPIQSPAGYEGHDMSPYYDYEAKLAEAQAAAAKRSAENQAVAITPDRDAPATDRDGKMIEGHSAGFDWRWILGLVALLAVGIFGWKWVSSA